MTMSKPVCLWISEDETAKAVSEHINNQFGSRFQMRNRSCFSEEDFVDLKNLFTVVLDAEFVPELKRNIHLSDKLNRHQITLISIDRNCPNHQKFSYKKSHFIRKITLQQTLSIDEWNIWFNGLFIEWRMSNNFELKNSVSLKEKQNKLFNNEEEILVDDDYYEMIFSMAEQGCELAVNLEQLIETYPPLNLLTEYEAVTSRLVYFEKGERLRPLPIVLAEGRPDKIMEGLIISLERAIELTVESFPLFHEIGSCWSTFGRVKALREKGFLLRINGSFDGDVCE